MLRGDRDSGDSVRGPVYPGMLLEFEHPKSELFQKNWSQSGSLASFLNLYVRLKVRKRGTTGTFVGFCVFSEFQNL